MTIGSRAEDEPTGKVLRSEECTTIGGDGLIGVSENMKDEGIQTNILTNLDGEEFYNL